MTRATLTHIQAARQGKFAMSLGEHKVKPTGFLLAPTEGFGNKEPFMRFGAF